MSKIIETLSHACGQFHAETLGIFNSFAYSESLWNFIMSSYRGHMHPIIHPTSRPMTVGTVKFVVSLENNIFQYFNFSITSSKPVMSVTL